MGWFTHAKLDAVNSLIKLICANENIVFEEKARMRFVINKTSGSIISFYKENRNDPLFMQIFNKETEIIIDI